MKTVFFSLLCILVLCIVPGCDFGGGGGDSGGSSTVAGQWSGSGTQDQGGTFTMTLGLAQSGAVVTGSYHIERPGRTMDGTISGTADAGTINLTFNPHGRASGAYGSNTMTLYWIEDWGGGVIGKSGTISLGKM